MSNSLLENMDMYSMLLGGTLTAIGLFFWYAADCIKFGLICFKTALSEKIDGRMSWKALNLDVTVKNHHYRRAA